MLGAIIGDLAGSIYEYDQTKNFKKIKINNIIEDNAFFSDDTILTIAIADAVLNNIDYAVALKYWANKYKDYRPKHEPYFKSIFSPKFLDWVEGNFTGESQGNGAMMRISPIGFLFNLENEITQHVVLVTRPSHNTLEAVECAKTVALIIFYARMGLSKQEIISKLNIEIKKPNISKFNYTCADTIDVCLYSLFKAESFEDSIRLAISFGGDTDTNACIVGSMAEAMYGISDELKKRAKAKLPQEFLSIIEQFYNAIQNLKG